ncbi:MAG: class I SAM-dependent methyltransferase [Acidimicrobiales bacterium]
MEIHDQIRRFWDADAAVYDDVPNHRPTDAGELSAWAATLARLLPPPPARVLDCGAGTGFLSVLAARQGHKVTALDISPAMLARLAARADGGGLGIEVVEGRADQPPHGPFDAVMERHLLWTLPDPVGTLRAWRAAAPMGRLVLFEGLWGRGDPLRRVRGAGRRALGRLQGKVTGHHGEYPQEVLAALPLGAGTTPAAVVEAVAAAGWPDPWLERLHDVEWATRMATPLPERLIGAPARFVVTAG